MNFEVLIKKNISKTCFLIWQIFCPLLKWIIFSCVILISDRSLHELISHCLGCDNSALQDQEDSDQDIDVEHLPPLHAECAQPSPSLEQITTLIQDGCDPNQILAGLGRTPLHTLLLVPHPKDSAVVPCVVALLEAGAHLDIRDSSGRTPLLCLEAMLRQARFQDCAQICQLFLSGEVENNLASRIGGYRGQRLRGGRGQCDVNSVDGSGRSLLSYSVTYLDLSAEVTRVLINSGGRVWRGPAPTSPASVEDLAKDREESAFTWFLRSLIHSNNFSNAESTLNCICHEMGRDPGRMKTHVQRVMVTEGKHPKVLGPLYLKLKLAMCPFWSEPQHLRYLAWNSIRRSIGPKRLSSRSQQLGLPVALRKYITLASSSSTSKLKK